MLWNELAKAAYPVRLETGDVGNAMPRDVFLMLVKAALQTVAVDEQWYLDAYPDVAAAVAAGAFLNARAHFVEHGYFEGRSPGPIRVQEDWYLSRYPDVGAAVSSGAVASAQRHFETHGAREGRLPFDGYRLFG